MQKIKYYLLLILFISTMKILAQDKKFGVGIDIGEPIALAINYKLNEVNSIDFSIGYSFLRQLERYSTHLSYLSIFDQQNNFNFYYGLGLRFIIKKELRKPLLGAKFSLGVKYIITKNIEVFGEAAPVLGFIPHLDPTYDVYLGILFYIK